MTGDDVFSETLTVLGVIYAGQTISTEAHATMLFGLNMMLSEWNATGLAVFSVVRTTPFALTSGTADYTIGTGGTIAIARPEKVEAWAVTDASGFASHGKPVDPTAFTAIALDRSLIGAEILALNYDAAYPTAAIHLYPKPNGGSLELWIWEQFSQITDSTQVIDFPQGYLEAIVFNLAIAVADKFGRQVTASVKTKADETKAAIGGVNAPEHASAPAPQAQ